MCAEKAPLVSPTTGKAMSSTMLPNVLVKHHIAEYIKARGEASGFA
jgi:hypothetical protein